MKEYNIENYQLFFMEPHQEDIQSAWIEHIPFAFFMVEILKPKIFVELGTHTGVSFNAFCQAAKILNIKTSFYAVDTWKGDEHAGFYVDEVYNKLLEYQNANYKTFAQLMRMTFDEALKYFNDNSIDLLHIDGCHTYEAVKHDYNNWIGKMSDRGVIIFHDTFVRRDNFGVWKLWEELKYSFPSFEFTHGYGLGILAVGKNVPEELLIFHDQANKNTFYNKFFERLGNYILIKNDLIKTRHELDATRHELDATRHELDKIKNSDTYRVAVKLEKIARKIGLLYPLKWMIKLYRKIFK